MSASNLYQINDEVLLREGAYSLKGKIRSITCNNRGRQTDFEVSWSDGTDSIVKASKISLLEKRKVKTY